MYLGIDIGSITAKAVLVDDSGQMIASSVSKSGFDHNQAAQTVADDVTQQAAIDMDKINTIVATGYGRNNIPFASRAITEITCHARGALHELPDCRMVVDIGGQDSKVILVGPSGRVIDFCMNDRCAAGTGRFLEVMANSLQIPLDEMGPLAMTADNPASISNVCTVFAESEVISLISAGKKREDIIRGLCRSISERVNSMVTRVGLDQPIAMTGGVALNKGVAMELEQMLGVTINVPSSPQIIGALGAALLAKEEADKNG
ncbi:MAG: acyl-CoA dehydratase activase [Thermodesulfobacteriota bacterium]